MGELLRTHLVFKEREKKFLKALNKYCQITGFDATLEGASKWAHEGGGEDPDLILINSTVYFSTSSKQKNAKTKDFLRILLHIKEQRRQSQMVLLLPEQMIVERELIVNLLKMQLYNFWFLDSFDEDDIQDFLLTRRALADIEKYLEEKERELQYFLLKNSTVLSKTSEKIFKPYHIKSNILTFWSEQNTTLNSGMALLAALNLAEHGFQVALVETVSLVPSLAACLSVNHPYFNTSHALSMYIQGNKDFIKNCLYNGEGYLNNPYTTQDSKYLKYLPQGLFLLPDAKREDNATELEMKEYWRAFVMELARYIIFEKGFHFLIIIGSGRNYFNQVVLDEVTYAKFITVDMLPASVLYGLSERKKDKGKTQIIGTNNLKSINKEITELAEEPFLYPSATFENDFLNFVYSQDYRKISRETQEFINILLEKVGVKIPDLKNMEKKSLVEKFTEYSKSLLK